MAELIERELEAVTGKAKIPTHALQSVMAEQSRGKLTTTQALDVFEAIAPPRLNSAEQAEVATIVSLVTSIPVTGSQAAQADGRAQRALKALEIDQVFLLMDAKAPGYQTAAEVRSKLGI